MGAEIERFSETVGNGMCAVPGNLPGISPSDSNGVQPIRNKSFPRGKLARPVGETDEGGGAAQNVA